MKFSIYLVLFLIATTAFAQQKTVEITNVKTGKIIVFEENQRVKIRTLDGKKHIGNLKFSDSLTLVVDNQSIKIDSLKSMKKQPKTLATIKTVFEIVGLATVGTSLVLASGGSNWSFFAFYPWFRHDH